MALALALAAVLSAASASPAHPAGAAGAAPPAPQLFTYTNAAGALPTGDDVAPPAKHTIATAEAACTDLPLCRGFTFVDSNTSATQQLTYFKSSARSPNASLAGWSTFVKVGVVTPPALTVKAVGSSNLTLSLRAGAYTVQSLGPSTDPWQQNFSFVRQLGSSLPSVTHIGDITIRLQQQEGAVAVGGAGGTGAGGGPSAAEMCGGMTNSSWVTFSSAVGVGPAAVPLAFAPGGKVL